MFSSLSAILAKLSMVLFLYSQALAAGTTLTIDITPNPVILPAPLERACSCESWGDPNNVPRQFNTDGSILWGHDPKTGLPVKRDVGACQINTAAHASEIASSGLNVVASLHDNEAFALMLYDKEGMKPWAASQSCWAK